MGYYSRYLFIIYVILLAGYATFKNISNLRLGEKQVNYEEPKQKCVEKEDWSYCVYTSSNNSRDLIYHLHGKGEDEKAWVNKNRFGTLLQQYWQDQKRIYPTVVSISFGRTWIITPKMSKPATGLLERFKEEVFKTIEADIGKPRRRYLLGSSMGALNAMTLAVPFTKQFSKVALLCPPIYDLSPYDSWEKMYDHILLSGAKLKTAYIAYAFGRKYFSSDEEWQKFAPLSNFKANTLSRRQQFYITASLRDSFGVYDGAVKLKNILQEKGQRVYWRPISGGHCSVDVTSLGDFLAN